MSAPTTFQPRSPRDVDHRHGPGELSGRAAHVESRVPGTRHGMTKASFRGSLFDMPTRPLATCGETPMKPLTTAALLLLLAGPTSAQTLDDLKTDGRNPDNILTYGMGYHLHRYSAL